MKTFTQWAEEKKLDLPTLTDVMASEPTDVQNVKPATNENGKRTGARPGYPDGYVRSQFPHKYFNPVTATADLDLQNAGKK